MTMNINALVILILNVSGLRTCLWVPVRQEVGTGTVLGIASFPDLLVNDPLSSERKGFGLKDSSLQAVAG